MAAERLVDNAIDVYLLGRERFKNDNLFALNMTNFYGALIQYDKATEELLKYYRTEPSQISIVDSYLVRYPKTDRIIREVEKQFRKAIVDQPNDLGLRQILSRYYLRVERYREALETTRELERLTAERTQGQNLYLFAQEAFRSGAPEEAAAAYKEILDSYPGFPSKQQVLFGLAQCQEAQENLQNAAATYQTIVDEFPLDPLSIKSLYRRGLIQRDRLFNLDEAVVSFQTLMEKFPNSAEARSIRLELGTCHVARGDLDRAEEIFRETLESQSAKGPFWLKALIRLADTVYLGGRFEESLSLLDELNAVSLGAGSVEEPLLNDGLNLRLFLRQHARRAPDALAFLARGEFFLRQRMYDKALSAFDSLLARSTGDPLAADALFKKGATLIRQEEYKKSLTSLDTLLARFPHHLLADQALERIGWVYEKIGNQDKALEQYEILLVSYPHSFQADDIRRRIRCIEKEKN